MSVSDDSTKAPKNAAYEYQPDLDGKVDFRRLPRLLRHAAGIVWRVGRRDFLVSISLHAVAGAAIGVQVFLVERILAALFAAPSMEAGLGTVVPWATAIAAVATLSLLASAVQREKQVVLGEMVQRLVEGRVLDVAASVDLEAFERPGFHNRLLRARTGDFQARAVVSGLLGVLSAALGGVAALAAILAIQPILLPLTAVAVFPAWLIASHRGEVLYRFYWRMTPSDRERDYLSHLLSGRESAAEVRAFGLPKYLRSRYEQLYERRIGELRRIARRQLVYSLFANLAIGASLGLTLLLVAWLTLTNRVSLAASGAAIAGVAVVASRLTLAGYAAGALSEAALFIEDYLSFLSLLPDVRVTHPGRSASTGFHRLQVEHVTFTYPSGDRPALKDVSLHIEAGEVIALVGENGSGKTTLAKLLVALYRPDSGRISWDAIDIATIDPASLRSQLAVIFQDFLHYRLTARENVGLGRCEALDDLGAIRGAARLAGADATLAGLPHGYHTVLGPEFHGGVDLSVGQWQRVALARALFRDAAFVILDEPTAALDPRAEYDLFRHIRSLLDGRTVLLISHRFSSVRSADRIYVLEEGRVVEQGSHAQLMTLRGLYAELFTMQASAYLGEGDSKEPARTRSVGPD